MYILAFYFSKFNVDAESQLGYPSFKAARENLSELFGFNANSFKNRRDDFDVLTGSHRTGWVNRPSTRIVKETTQYLQSFSFEELTALVKSLIENVNTFNLDTLENIEMSTTLRKVDLQRSENEIEQLINFEDPGADLLVTSGDVPRRIYRRSIIEQLKKLYHYQCQICGYSFENTYGANYAEAHHIDHFAKTQNNDAKNIIILCPNHHRIIHQTASIFDRNSLLWNYPNGLIEPLKHNIHL